MLNIQCVDPSGETRTIRIEGLPAVLGTKLIEKMGLRDPKLPDAAVEVSLEQTGELILKSLSPSLDIRLGDLRLQSLKIPMHAPLKIGDTELIFSSEEYKKEPLEFPRGEKPWFTESPAGAELIRAVKRGSQTSLSLYLYGETGTGKEVLARLAHAWSARASGAFVAINCGALPLGLAESELFGHVKGSFTGAVRDRPGAFLQAHGGTLFLDEVGDLPMEIQVKLLRFLESGEIRPVGSDRTLNSDARIICATHKPLAKLVKEGKFRQDLYFRLASIPIEIPTLRDRPEDIEVLANIFAKEHSKVMTKESLMRLKAYTWPGNVRELRHAVERACGAAGPFEPMINTKEFDFLVEQSFNSDEDTSAEDGGVVLPGVYNLKEMERVMIVRALKMVKGNRSDAARVLGIARSTLFEMLKRHEIVGPKSTEYWISLKDKGDRPTSRG